MNENSYIQTLSERVYQSPGDLQRGSPSGAANPSAATREAGATDTVVGRRYTVSTRIGSGRLGPIYEGFDGASREIGANRRVAIQLLDEAIASEQRWVDELARGYAALRGGSHPNIVKILDFGQEGRMCFLVMELLEGASLRFVLDQAAPEALSINETAAVMRAVGDALQHLHAKGIVHGNLKPENVFVTIDYAVKLLDIAPLSRPAMAVPYYVEDAEPEAPSARDVRDDVYDLACLAYEVAAGRHPFNANSPLEAQRAGLTPIPVDALTARQWQAIVRGLALQRAQRTPTVAEFLSEFGIAGSERLRASSDEASAARSVSDTRPAPAPTTARPSSDDTRPMFVASAEPSAPAATRRPQPSLVPPAHRVQDEWDRDETWLRPRFLIPRPKRTATVRIVLSIVLAAGLVALALANYERLRDGAVALMAATNSQFGDGSDTGGDAAVDVRVERPAGTDVEVAAGGAARDEPLPGENDAANNALVPADAGSAADAAATGPGTGSTVAVPDDAAASAAATADLGSDAAPGTTVGAAGIGSDPAIRTNTETAGVGGDPATGTNAETAGVGGDPEAGATAEAAGPAESPGSGLATGPAPPQAHAPGLEVAGEPRWAFAQSTLTVPESLPAAPVVIRRTGDSSAPASIVWWTGDDTAIAGDDYADLGQRTENFAAGEQSRTVYVPLVNDGLPEGRESLYVFLGRYHPERRHLEALSRIRVDISDDD